MYKFTPETMIKKTYGNYTITDIREAVEHETILEAPVTKCTDKLELRVKLGHDIFGYIPFNEFEFSRGKVTKSGAVSAKVGKTVQFIPKTIEETPNGYFCRLSRKDVQRRCYNEYISNLKEGQIIDAVVTNIVNFGLFCDIGCGIAALLPINNVSMGHLLNPYKDLSGVHKLKVAVKSIDENGKITLTHKELLGTWKENVELYKKDETVTGAVREVKEYGVYVELTPNLIGVADPYPGVKENDLVSVLIRDIIPSEIRVKLLITNKIGERRGRIYYKYFLPKDMTLGRWVYSPEESKRVIETNIGLDDKPKDTKVEKAETVETPDDTEDAEDADASDVAIPDITQEELDAIESELGDYTEDDTQTEPVEIIDMKENSEEAENLDTKNTDTVD